jgi:hypothetical protein
MMMKMMTKKKNVVARKNKKSKCISVTGSETVNITRRPSFNPKNSLGTHFC